MRFFWFIFVSIPRAHRWKLSQSYWWRVKPHMSSWTAIIRKVRWRLAVFFLRYIWCRVCSEWFQSLQEASSQLWYTVRSVSRWVTWFTSDDSCEVRLPYWVDAWVLGLPHDKELREQRKHWFHLRGWGCRICAIFPCRFRRSQAESGPRSLLCITMWSLCL